MINSHLTSLSLLYLEPRFEKFLRKNFYLRLRGTFRMALSPFKIMDETVFPTLFNQDSVVISDKLGRTLFSSNQHLTIVLFLCDQSYFKVDFDSTQRYLLSFRYLPPERMVILDKLASPNRRFIISVTNVENISMSEARFLIACTFFKKGLILDQPFSVEFNLFVIIK